jgi:prepilin-type processing-associated H-X9-DG protein
MPRVRSVSMNGFVEGDAYNQDKKVSGQPLGAAWWYYNPPWYCYKKLSDIRVPPPALLWVFVDEHPDSINDGWLITDVMNPNHWEDLPASYHNGACGFGFADGHSEIKKWQESSTVVAVQQRQYNDFSAPNSRDVRWMVEHSSAPIQ